MSENDQDADFPIEDSEPPKIEVKDEKPPRKRGGGVAWLAFLFSIVAIAMVGYRWFEDWRAPEDTSQLDTIADISELRSDLRATNDSIGSLKSRVDAIPRTDYSGDIAAVEQNVEEQLELLNTLPSRMSTLENSVASLAGISQGARETFLLAEAEYYMQIANAQLQLANNPTLATLALRMADERVTQLADPALTDVRRALSDELASLEVMEIPDLEGATLTLASLARVVESLPLASQRQDDDTAEEISDKEQGTMDRAWTSVKDAMSGLVKVTPPEQAKLAILSPDAEYFLRNNIALQLQAARLALLRGERTIFQQSLDDTTALLNAYFDTESEPVGSALQTIGEIKASVFAAANPDISGSLRLLRQYRTLSETVE